MKLSRRSLFTLSGAAVAASALTACGSNTGGVNTGQSAPASSGAAVALSQWYHEYGEKGVQEAVSRYAAQYQAAKVTVKWNPGNYDQLIPTVLLTNDVPDIFEYANGPTLDMIKAGQVVDLTDVIGPVAANFNKPVIDRLTYQGKIWAVPQTIDMQLLYYRKSVLAAKNLQPPKTFAEFVTAAKAVKTNDMGGFFAGNDGGVGVLGLLLIWASGHNMLNADETALGFLTPQYYQALTAYRDLFNSGALLQSASADWFSASAFVNGEAAMQWSGLWALPDIQAKWGDDFGVLAFPAIGANGRLAVPFGAYSACVPTKSKNAAAAKAFIKWLWIDQEDKQIDFSTSYGTHIPAKPALAAKSPKLASGPGADAATMVAQNGFANHILWTGALGDAYSAAISNVIKKNADPASEMSAVAAKAITELQRAKG